MLSSQKYKQNSLQSQKEDTTHEDQKEACSSTERHNNSHTEADNRNLC